MPHRDLKQMLLLALAGVGNALIANPAVFHGQVRERESESSTMRAQSSG
jgi:hypothetical protein